MKGRIILLFSVLFLGLSSSFFDLKMVAHSLFSLNFFTSTTITIIIVFLLSSTSYGYGDCSSSWSCGNVTNIGYPFWGGERPPYCGHPKLELQCPNDYNKYPVLHINDPGHDDDHIISFEVLGIWNNTKSLRTIMLQQTPLNSSCPTNLFENGMFGEYPFNFSTNVTTTPLFYDLNAFIRTPGPSDSVPCFATDVYYLRNQSDPYKYCDNGLTCKSYDVPVFQEDLDRLKQGKETLMDVLNKGFEVDFNYSVCIHCENSGGVCGSSIMPPSQFVCYCKVHPYIYPEKCPKSGNWKRILILGLAILGGLAILIAFNVAICCYMKKNKFQTRTLLAKTFSYYRTMSDLESGYSFFGIPVFSCYELQEATNNFDSARELGDGGYGVVYHGKLRDGREVAVKRLYKKNFKRVEQFINEIEILTKLRHQNLVRLYGCSSHHNQELLLVYEFIPNGTVADHLYRDQSRSRTITISISEPLPWSIRMQIAIQTACALSYLHASDIIHRDVKTNNILLDSNFTVKVADFGLSRLFPCDATHVSTAPHGTPGYLDPEYRKCYQVSNKSDVYSFGVVLIELISSLPAIDLHRNEDEINLSDYAMNRIQKGELEALVDRNLGFQSDFKVKRMTTLVAEIAFQCLQQEKEVRPSMEEVFEALKRIESVDYEALESEEMCQSPGILKSTPGVGENGVDHQICD